MAKYIIKVAEDTMRDALDREIEEENVEKSEDVKYDNEKIRSTIKTRFAKDRVNILEMI